MSIWAHWSFATRIQCAHNMPAHAAARGPLLLTVARAAGARPAHGGFTAVPTEVLLSILRFAFDRDAYPQNKRTDHAVATLVRLSRVSSKMRRVVHEFASLYVQSHARFHLWPRYVSYCPRTTAPVLCMRGSRVPSTLHICLLVVYTQQQRHCTTPSTAWSASWMPTKICVTFCYTIFARSPATWWRWMPSLCCRSSIEQGKKHQHTCMSAAGAWLILQCVRPSGMADYLRASADAFATTCRSKLQKASCDLRRST